MILTPELPALAMAVLLAAAAWPPPEPSAGEPQAPPDLDRRVRAFLDAEKGKWDYLNVPFQDGQILHDLVVKQGAKRILEVGTSTGHSTIWLAWAAAKTGGRVTTIEIDRGRHERALANFKAAGVADYIDARLGDAHDLVKQLPGPWDVVFQDADKDWYHQYFRDLEPKMASAGCYAAHNVVRPGGPSVERFVAHVTKLPAYASVRPEGESSAGLLVSCKKPS